MGNIGSLLVHRVDPPELAEARSWFQKAAEAGTALATDTLPRDLNAYWISSAGVRLLSTALNFPVLYALMSGSWACVACWSRCGKSGV